MWKVVWIVAASLVAFVTGARILGSYRWNAETKQLRARLDAAQRSVSPSIVDFDELEGLPSPVQRFFRTALTEGRPLVSRVRVRHQGTFNMGENADRWRPFNSEQQVVTQRPGFDWDGRIAMMPGVRARVHDAYIAGEGILHASLAGLVSLSNLRGTGGLAADELMRFFAEATWYPSALLPSQGVRWEPVDERSARATLTDADISVTMLFTFDEAGLVETVRAEARGRTVAGATVSTPWEGRFLNYQERDGMRVPFDGEVAWLLSSGAKTYWRGRITEIVYEFAR